MAAVVSKTIELCKVAVVASKPILNNVQYYARVELVPPKVSDIPAIKNGIAKLINGVKTGAYLNVTVREAVLNTLVTTEVLCWFFVGECIGKRHLIGYNV
ncbi:ATP synthase subunit g, mitochondrial-like [Hylaeus anthracinus]|uniref:ATP synthase subunit g, mitochondrial-like n=1 Tax=Hylaeus anthracinus TaxID=313031 RepID=UPI0023BA3A56|nr:ATP synthase subunit g, mitochondrial-like [Hylaeus anthracinus]